ncbi:MAG: diaminopimelate epimerase [Balneolales bacterium]
MPKEYFFEKMHGAGNDFIVIDARAADFSIDLIKNNTARLCHRRTGIGADGILMLDRSKKNDYSMHYLNADGSEAGMCGNGARCLAHFAFRHGFSSDVSFDVHGLTYQASVHNSYVSVQFPVDPKPLLKTIEGVIWCVVDAGTEHIVSIDKKNPDIPEEELRQTGRRLRNRIDLFPHGTNVNFANVLDENRLELITYERGVEDLTLACGTGAIATAISWYFLKQQQGSHSGFSDIILPDTELMDTLQEKSLLTSSGQTLTDPAVPEAEPVRKSEQHIQLDCPGGPLEVSFTVIPERDHPVYKNIVLHGPAVSVYNGKFVL